MVVPKGVRVGYVPQYVEYKDEDSVWDCIAVEYQALTETLREQEERLSQATPENMESTLQSYQRARDAYDRIEGDMFPQTSRDHAGCAVGLQGKMEQAHRVAVRRREERGLAYQSSDAGSGLSDPR